MSDTPNKEEQELEAFIKKLHARGTQKDKTLISQKLMEMLQMFAIKRSVSPPDMMVTFAISLVYQAIMVLRTVLELEDNGTKLSRGKDIAITLVKMLYKEIEEADAKVEEMFGTSKKNLMH